MSPNTQNKHRNDAFDSVGANKWSHFTISMGQYTSYIAVNGIMVAEGDGVDTDFPSAPRLTISCTSPLCDGAGYDSVAIINAQVTPRHVTQMLPIRGCVGYSCASDHQGNTSLCMRQAERQAERERETHAPTHAPTHTQ